MVHKKMLIKNKIKKNDSKNDKQKLLQRLRN